MKPLCKECIHCVPDKDYHGNDIYDFAKCNAITDCMGKPKQYCSVTREFDCGIKKPKWFKPKEPPNPPEPPPVRYISEGQTDEPKKKRWWQFFSR